MRIWKTGDAVAITCADRTVQGEVKLASSNGVSLMLEFEAILAGHVAMMPVVWNEGVQAFLSVMTGIAVELGECQQEEDG